ncbi:MAG: NAD(P)H-dependent oxidoreductase subunit E [Promethearchaeota archaeon]
MEKNTKNTKINLRICCGMNCLAHGGQELLDSVENDTRFTNNVDIEAVECRDTCGDGGYKSPVIELNDRIYPKMTVERLWELLDKEIDKFSK